MRIQCPVHRHPNGNIKRENGWIWITNRTPLNLFRCLSISLSFFHQALCPFFVCALCLTIRCKHCGARTKPICLSVAWECCLLSREMWLNFAFCITTDLLSRAHHGTDRCDLWWALVAMDSLFILQTPSLSPWGHTKKEHSYILNPVITHQPLTDLSRFACLPSFT